MKIKHWLTLCVTLFSALAGRAADSGLTVETGGLQIVLPAGWESMVQPTNQFVQTRARHPETGRTFSAGSFKLDVTLPQYVAIGLAAIATGADTALTNIATKVKLPLAEVERALKSPLAQQTMDGVKRASGRTRVEVVKFLREEIDGQVKFELHSKLAPVKTGPTIYSRQIFLQPSPTNGIVQITFGGTSGDVLTDKSLTDAIRVKKK